MSNAGPLGRATAEAVEFARLAALFYRFARFHERAKVGAMNEKWSPCIRGLESGRDPSTDRVLMRPDEGAQLGDRVAVMEFDAAAVEPPRHGLLRRLNELADVLDLPDGCPRAQLHRLREATDLDTRPPGGAANRDRSLWGEDRSEPDEANRRKRCLLCSIISVAASSCSFQPYPSERRRRRRPFT